MEKTISVNLSYYLIDGDKQNIYTYYGALYLQKIQEFLNSLPKIIKEKTFPILELYRLEGKITSNLERYFDKKESDRRYYQILEYKVKKDNVENEAFLTTKEDCNTIAYDIFLRWEEMVLV